MLNIIIASLLSSAPNVNWFEGKLIYENPIAYVRSPESGIALKSSKYKGVQFEYLDAEIGRTVPIVRWNNNDLDLQLGLEVGSWLVLGYKDGAFPMLTQDFLAAVPLMFRFGSFSGALKWSHLSSHFGDNFDVLWEKTLTPEQKHQINTVEDQGDVSIFPAIHSYSRDFISGEIADETNFGSLKLKSYIQLAYVYKMIPRYLKRWSGGIGNELRCFNFFLAEDFHYYQDVDDFGFSTQLGWLLQNHTTEPKVYLGYYHGSDRRGKLLGRKMTEYSFGFAVR